MLADHHPRGEIRKSKSGKRRAIVLLLVHLLIIVHIVLWVLSKKYGWFGGKTISPVEPSESMEFVKNGVVNAGLIFFALALLSTLIFGRWFCGWGCHVVMLQDFCGWIMKKLGVRPKLFRSRFLVYVPLILAIYMFIMPAAHRWGLVPLDERMAASLGEKHWLVQSIRTSSTELGFPLPYPNLPPWKATPHLTTTDFWKTFAGYGVAIPFLLICGFATVYFLGAKGFCTYGCPYGGFFAPLDRLAAGRIRVTDACEGCGHCTAVCTSNVRVHDEVREYGMVVDPGCMKCLDCVSVCPNEALYFGFGKPSIAKGAAKNAKPKRAYDMMLGEEFAAAALFLLSFLAVRGVYGLVPMLMAAGMAGITTFLTWKLWRLLRDQNVTFNRFQLKLKGAMRPAGWVFGAAVVSVLLLTVHSGVVNAAVKLAGRHDAKVRVAPDAPFIPNNIYMSPQMDADADRAISLYTFASTIGHGGVGLLPTWQTAIDLKIVRLLVAKREFPRAEAILRRAMARDGQTDELVSDLMWVLFGQGRTDQALQTGRAALINIENMDATLDAFVQFCQITNDSERLLSACRERLARFPNDLKTMRWLSIVMVQSGMLEEGVALVRRTIEIDPKNVAAYRFLSMTLADMGDLNGAAAEMAKAIELAPKDAVLQSLMADLLEAAGRAEEAKRYRERAEELRASAKPR